MLSNIILLAYKRTLEFRPPTVSLAFQSTLEPTLSFTPRKTIQNFIEFIPSLNSAVLEGLRPQDLNSISAAVQEQLRKNQIDRALLNLSPKNHTHKI